MAPSSGRAELTFFSERSWESTQLLFALVCCISVHSICVLEEQLIFCHGSSQCYVVGGPSPPISEKFDMKADDVVPTFVLLNIFLGLIIVNIF